MKSQLSKKESTQISIILIRQICDIDLEQLELISEFVTKSEESLPKEMKVWEPFFDIVSIEMYKERKQLMGSVDDEWIMWLYNKSFENDNTNIEKNLHTDKNTETQKTKKQKGKGGRPPDPKLPEKKNNLRKEYYRLTEKVVFPHMAHQRPTKKI